MKPRYKVTFKVYGRRVCEQEYAELENALRAINAHMTLFKSSSPRAIVAPDYEFLLKEEYLADYEAK